jgi:uncharacterized repeat protein (TIGR01451 family)
MSVNRLTIHRYHAVLIASLISAGSLIPMLPALADQNSPTPTTAITNQATGQFTDDADSSTPQKIESNIVSVTVAEVAGITAVEAGVQGAGGTNVYRTNTVYFDFKVTNTGNDPTQFFIPGAPSSVTITSGTTTTAITTGIQQIQVIEYGTVAPGTNVVTTTTIDKNNLVLAAGSATGNLVATTTGSTAIPNGGSIPAGGYVKVRVPVTVPFSAQKDDVIKVTLGNTASQPGTSGLDNSNIPYVAGANGATGTGNDLYTKDNPDTFSTSTLGEAIGVPINGDGPVGDGNASLHRQEASVTQQATVVNPQVITISGTVWDDRNNSALGTFTNINDNGELATNGVFGTNITPINVILVNTDTGLVIANKTLTATAVADRGIYSFPNIQAITNVKIYLSDLPGTAGQAPPTAPTSPATTISSLNWVGTSPLSNTFLTGLTNTTQDFGIRQKAKLVLVKRITGMKKSTDLATDPMRRINPNDNTTNLSTYVNEATNPNDDSTMNWPTAVSANLIGAVDGGKVSPGDTIEYTIYFLNNQGANATNVRLCDPIINSQTFNNGGYGTGIDMQLQLDGGSVIDLTAAIDTKDRAYAYAAGSPPSGCNITGTDNLAAAGVAIDLTGTVTTKQPALTAIIGATGHGTAGSYGLFRFTTTVKP